MTLTMVFVTIFLLQSILTSAASRQNQEPAVTSTDADVGVPDPALNTADVGVPDTALNTAELLQDIQEQLKRQAVTIARQELLQLQSQKQSERQLEMIERQELKLQSQKQEIDGLKQLVMTQQTRQAETTTGQELKLQSQTRAIEELQQQVTRQQVTIDAHAKQAIIQKRLLKQLSKKFKLGLDKMSNEITELATSIPSKHNSPSRITRQGQEGHVAFSAYLNGNLEHLAPGHIIKMKGVTLNEGNAYNPNNGIFTTPQNGVYLFSFAIEDYRVHQLLVALVVDGTLMSSAATQPFHTYQNLQGTNVVILRLTTGQQVWTEKDMNDGDDSIEGTSRYRATTFSGVFLYT